MVNLRINEAQMLYEVLQDPTMRICLHEFFRSQYEEYVGMVVNQVRKDPSAKDALSHLGGKVDAYATGFSELEYFAKRMLKEATQ